MGARYTSAENEKGPGQPVLTRAFVLHPPGTRTQNLRIKSPLLYPIELEAREREYIKLMRLDRGVTEGTRTPNPQDHNLVL